MIVKMTRNIHLGNASLIIVEYKALRDDVTF